MSLNELDLHDLAAKTRAVAAIFMNNIDGFEMRDDEAHGVCIILNEIADKLEPRQEPEGGAQ